MVTRDEVEAILADIGLQSPGDTFINLDTTATQIILELEGDATYRALSLAERDINDAINQRVVEIVHSFLEHRQHNKITPLPINIRPERKKRQI